ncbi:MAG TPA: amidase [Gammaproteobacteria bacterium]|jgi:amidase|nr:amidase [Gammaproteobacteria bacterium]
MDSDFAFLGLVELGKLIAQRKLSSLEVTNALMERIERIDPGLRSHVAVLRTSALKEARRADREIKQRKKRGPLHGVPVALKDLCDVKGVATTAGLPMFRKAIADRDATVTVKLRAAGAVVLGKLHLTEGALAQHHPDVPPPVNPWAKNRWSGASSSGTGVAVAAGLTYGALGSDTGGSIRFPSSCNGVVGLKPTWGRVSRYGVYPLSETLDHVGPLTRSVEDAAAMLAAIAGRDGNDPTSASVTVPDYLGGSGRGVKGLRVGIDRKYAFDGVDPAIKRSIERALRTLKAAGATVVPFKMPPLAGPLAAWTPLCATEAALAHAATYPRRKRGYSETYAGFLEAGRAVSGLEYAQAEIARRELTGQMDSIFESIDLMIKPVYAKLNPTLKAFDAQCAKEGGLDELIYYTAPDDMTGQPTITLPAGLDKNGSPLSFQIVARRFEEALLFRAGRVWQQAADWRGLRPPLAE